MSSAAASLAALVLAIVLSFSTRVNVGIPAVALAWLLGLFFLGGKPEAVTALFPASLFLTLLGVTLLFAAADANGTLSRAADQSIRAARGDRRIVPALIFFIALVLSASGP